MTAEAAQPTRVGDYDVLRWLSRGHYGEAMVVSYRGTESVLKLAYTSTGDIAERLRDEARVLRALDHPGVPKLFDEGTDAQGRPFLVMSLAPGRTLAERLAEHAARNDRFSDLEALLVMKNLLDVLAYMVSSRLKEAQGGVYVHRDIKAANMLVTDSLDVTLIDFGFSKLDGSTDKRYDDSFFRAGAARLLPPRKDTHTLSAVASHDVFAVGVLGYQMLTGEYPWSTSRTGDDGDLLDAMNRICPRSQ